VWWYLQKVQQRVIMFQTPSNTPPKDTHFSFASNIIGNEFDVSNAEFEIVDLSSWENEAKYCVVVHGVLSPQECSDMIDKTESVGYEPALVLFTLICNIIDHNALLLGR
jgi:hypothetical protein